MRIAELRYKEIINVSNGHRLGFVGDVDMDVVSGKVMALIVPGPCRFFGLFGREDDYVLPFDAISRIGSDIILVDIQGEYQRGKRNKRPGF
ncbi:MAG: YlmC/YmxH family sporulation protein [Butyricicoccus sp.]|nr:YlmC/YmxH family sporulation protein [Butyricicoccus sp.]